MKLRLEGNSIRLRVRKSDLMTLQKEGAIKEALLFPNNQSFDYQLITDNNLISINAELSPEGMTVLIPLSIATTWIHSETVGIEQTLSSGLFILIEKDFPCKDRFDEDKKDTFFELIAETEAC